MFDKIGVKVRTVVAKKDKTTLLVILLTKLFYSFWPPLYCRIKSVSLLTSFSKLQGEKKLHSAKDLITTYEINRFSASFFPSTPCLLKLSL